MPDAPSAWLSERLAAHGARPFLHTPAGTASYVDLVAAVAAQRAALGKQGVAPGETVLLAADYSLSATALLLALVAQANIVVPALPGREHELAHRAAITGATHLARATDDGTFAWTRRVAPRTAAPPALLARLAAAGRAGLVLFSSGSAGEPKAMVHDLDNLLASYADRRPRALTLVVFLLFDHIGGLNTLFTALATGSALVVPATREPDHVCALIARHRASILPASPTFLNLLLLSDAWRQHDLSSLRIITYGTEPMPESLLARLRRAFPAVKLLQTFGTSETGISRTTSRSSDSTLFKLDDPDLEHRVVDGELWLRSRTQILGYLNHPMHAFTTDGWFRTGDLVEEAGDGYLRIAGRQSEVINVGGEKVLPAEVESVLLTLPEVGDCLVYGEANALTGQVVCAEIAPAPGVDPAGLRLRIRTACRGRLAPFKIPVKIVPVRSPLLGERLKKRRQPAPPPAP